MAAGSWLLGFVAAVSPAPIAPAIQGAPPRAPPHAIGDAAAVTLDHLLAELIDRDAIARLPSPGYVTKQASSYDRRSKSRDDLTENGWFANTDNMDGAGADLKWVKHGGRDECVLVDADGPGALTRLWLGGKKGEGTLRFYLDKSDEPALAGVAETLLSGEGAIPSPLAVRTAGNALNMYLPIPFAQHLQITCDEGVPGQPPPQRWFNAEYRLYAAGTTVRSFAANDLERARDALVEFAAKLAAPADVVGEPSGGGSVTLAPGAPMTTELADGPRALETLVLSFPPGEVTPRDASPLKVASRPAPLRSIVVVAKFDDEATVWCPASELFGCGPTLVDFTDWRRTTHAASGTLIARFPMPYQKTASITLLNLGSTPVTPTLTLYSGPFACDERTLRFHASWHCDHHMKTRPFRDFDFVKITGAGLYAGDTLTVVNPVRDWWGEGDEKVFVDGEPFPSHFGTGSEDHYGFAWGATTLFATPFGGQPRVDGPGNMGTTTVTRSRLLDVIPFTSSLEYDLEVWHWADCEISYSVGSFWYARPGATSNRAAQAKEAAEVLAGAGIPGALEAEELKVVARSDGLPVETQTGVVFPAGRWSRDAQLFVKGRQIGDFVELELPPPPPPTTATAPMHRLRITLTKSYDYGVLRFTCGGAPLCADYDAFDAKGDLAQVELAPLTATATPLVLRIEVVGRNAAAKGSGCFFGIDALEWLP